MMIREQDRTIDSISGTLSNLAHQAGLMGQEIVEHTEYVVIVLARFDFSTDGPSFQTAH